MRVLITLSRGGMTRNGFHSSFSVVPVRAATNSDRRTSQNVNLMVEDVLAATGTESFKGDSID